MISIRAQHYPSLSQFMFSGMIVNPAYAGSHDALAANFIYRNQWIGFDGAPKTMAFSAHSPMSNPRIALGAMVYSDQHGITQHNGTYLNYAFRIPFPSGKLALGIKAGVDFLQTNWDDIHLIEQNDKSFQADYDEHFVFPNMGLGMYFHNQDFFAGFSIPMLFSYREQRGEKNGYEFHHKPAFYSYHLMMGGKLIKERHWSLEPSLLLKYRKYGGLQMQIASLVNLKEQIWFGAGYQSSQALTALLQYAVNKQLKVSYSYDYSLGFLNQFNQGTHEIGLRYEFSYYIKAQTPRY